MAAQERVPSVEPYRQLSPESAANGCRTTGCSAAAGVDPPTTAATTAVATASARTEERIMITSIV
jgi:hypothetical protein